MSAMAIEGHSNLTATGRYEGELLELFHKEQIVSWFMDKALCS
jgi:hypothetical protein